MAKKKFKGTIFTGTTGDDVADADGVFSHSPPGITGFTPNNLAKLQDNRGDIIRGLAGNDQVSAGPPRRHDQGRRRLRRSAGQRRQG